jgi:hypothetical protein
MLSLLRRRRSLPSYRSVRTVEPTAVAPVFLHYIALYEGRPVKYTLKMSLVALALMFLAGKAFSDEPVPVGPVPPQARPAPKYVDLKLDTGIPATMQTKIRALRGRTFDRIWPSINADPRSIARIYFNGQLKVYAQRAEANRATHEWEVSSSDITVFALDEKSCYKVVMIAPSVRTILGDKHDFDKFEFHVKLGARRDDVMFRFPKDVKLPQPLPAFTEWAKCRELKRYDGG